MGLEQGHWEANGFPELQEDEDRYYAESMGNPNDALWVDQFMSSQGVVTLCSDDEEVRVEIPAVMLRLKPMKQIGIDQEITVVIPTDISDAIAYPLHIYAGKSVEWFIANGRVIHEQGDLA